MDVTDYIVQSSSAGVWMKGACVNRDMVEKRGFDFDHWLKVGAILAKPKLVVLSKKKMTKVSDKKILDDA